MNEVHINISVSCFSFYDKKSDKHIAFCPALNMSDYSSDEDDAMSGLDSIINDAVEHAVSKGTVIQWLLDLGWKVQTKPVLELDPPKESFLSEFKKWSKSKSKKQTLKEIQFA